MRQAGCAEGVIRSADLVRANSRILALFTSPCFGIVRTIVVFVQVEMPVVDASVSRPAGQVREYS
jgi:hypothetical protein